tara:strand:+ start:709 stop:1059 length:351 start_codon:yes stop_codon:yes gene_type:complete
MINAIFKIEEYLKDRNSIVVRICRLHSHIPIDDYTAKIVDCNDLDTTDIDMFVDGLMKKSGIRRIKIQEEKSPILKENIPDKIDGELDLQSLVGKVVEGKVDDWRRKPIKMREVEL